MGRVQRWRSQLNLLPINYSVAIYETGVANFFCEGPDSKYFQFCGPESLSQAFMFNPVALGPKAVIYKTLTNGHGCVLTKHCLEKQALTRMWPNQLKFATPPIGG